MILFKPRLAAFYVVLFVTIALLSNRVSIATQKVLASPGSQTIDGEMK